MYGNAQHGRLAPPRLDGTANTDYDAPDTRAELRRDDVPRWLVIVVAAGLLIGLAAVGWFAGVAWVVRP